MNITDGFLVSEKIAKQSRGLETLLVSGSPVGDFSDVHVDPLVIDMAETHKILLKFGVPDNLVHGTVYMFKYSDSRGPLIFHESMKAALSAAHDTECVCARLRVSSGVGSISMSRTVYKYIFPDNGYADTQQPVSPPVHDMHAETVNTNIEKFERCITLLRKVEFEPLAFAEDVAYLASILRVPDHIAREHSREMVETIRKSGGDIQRVIDVHSRATRISTLLSMMDA